MPSAFACYSGNGNSFYKTSAYFYKSLDFVYKIVNIGYKPIYKNIRQIL